MVVRAIWGFYYLYCRYFISVLSDLVILVVVLRLIAHTYDMTYCILFNTWWGWVYWYLLTELGYLAAISMTTSLKLLLPLPASKWALFDGMNYWLGDDEDFP